MEGGGGVSNTVESRGTVQKNSAGSPPAEEWQYCNNVLRPGNTNCAGCGMSIGLQWLDQALDGQKPTLVIPASCGIVSPLCG